MSEIERVIYLESAIKRIVCGRLETFVQDFSEALGDVGYPVSAEELLNAAFDGLPIYEEALYRTRRNERLKARLAEVPDEGFEVFLTSENIREHEYIAVSEDFLALRAAENILNYAEKVTGIVLTFSGVMEIPE